MEKSAPRYPYLDLLKILAMIMVCSYHFADIPSIEYRADVTFISGFPRALFGINSVCVPIFFMVNGALMLCSSSKNVYYEKHFLKIVKLLLGLYIWRLITVIIIRLYRGEPLPVSDFFSAFIGNSKGIELNHLWFLMTLIAIYMIYPLLHREFQIFRENAIASYIPLFTATLIILLFAPLMGTSFLRFLQIDKAVPSLSYFSPFVDRTGGMILYFVAGGILHSKRDFLKRIHFIGPIIGFVLGFFLLYYLWWQIHIWEQYDWNNVYAAYTTFPCFLMSICLFTIAAKMQFPSSDSFVIKVLKFFGSNTLGVYYMHWIYGYTLHNVMLRFFSANTLVTNFMRGCIWTAVFALVSGTAKKLLHVLISFIYVKKKQSE